MRATLVVVSLVALLAGFEASASGGKYPSQGEAYTACMADAKNGPSAWQPMRCNESLYNGGGGSYNAWDRSGRDVGWPSYWWSAGTDCKTRGDEMGWQGGETAATVNVCHTGCMYSSSLDPSSPSGFTYYPTGGSCTESDAPAPTPAGDGGDPGGGDGGGTDPGGGDGGGDNGGGDGGGGTDPGDGDGGGGTGPGDGDGGGDDGGGDGGGTGPGPGPGSGEGDGDGPGQPGGDGDALYESEGKTVEKLYDDFAERVSKAPIIDATKSFFEISVSASCPIFTFPATAYWDAMTFDFLCKPEIVAILQLLGWLLLAFAAFHAIKIALT
ncbi:hypothetical protein JAK38_11695 [Stenotrophomonas maltophilia]|nr:hypothetical protein [Stenotrophomonas maltophilia]